MKNKKAAIAIFVIPLVLIILLDNKSVTLTAEKDIKQSTLVLNNPNLLSSTIKSIHEKFYVNGVSVGIVDNELNQGIPGRKDSEFPLNIRFPRAALNFVPPADSMVTIKTEGEVDYTNLVGKGQIIIGSKASVHLQK
jgi:hypothetical protein